MAMSPSCRSRVSSDPTPTRRVMSAPPFRRRPTVARLQVPVVACLSHQSVRSEANAMQARDRRLRAVRLDEQRPVLDRGRVALLDRLAEPDLRRLRLRDDAAQVRPRVLELAEGVRTKDAVVGIEPRRRLTVAG